MPKRPNQPNSPFCPGSKELTARLTYNDFDYNSCVAAAADMANTRQTPPQCNGRHTAKCTVDNFLIL